MGEVGGLWGGWGVGEGVPASGEIPSESTVPGLSTSTFKVPDEIAGRRDPSSGNDSINDRQETESRTKDDSGINVASAKNNYRKTLINSGFSNGQVPGIIILEGRLSSTRDSGFFRSEHHGPGPQLSGRTSEITTMKKKQVDHHLVCRCPSLQVECV
jgi:hypothetical protein